MNILDKPFNVIYVITYCNLVDTIYNKFITSKKGDK